MLNPFGMDDDDFEVDALIERNMMISYSYVEDLFDKAPRLVDIEVTKLPHTMASAALMGKANPMIGSAANIKIKKADQRQLNKDNFQKITNFMKHPIASSTRSVEGISTLPFDNHETSQKKFATPTSSARDEKDDPRKIAFDLDEAIEKLTKLRESQFADQMPSMNSKPPSRHRDLDLMSAKTQTPSLVAEKPEEKTKRSKKMNLDKIAPPVNETAHSAANSAAVSRQAAQPDRRTDKDVKKEIRVLVEKFLRNENVKIETAPSRSMNKISTESTRRPLTTPIATTVASAENSVRVQKIVRPDFDPNLDETQKDDIP
ncbi:unnamed protein product [Caenorhabditis auriculariae]|uniref:Bestrophin homolog n=1 Tax=Caenorhabditis auriculariae TaxID=2777116 RepID=A0A8S1GXL3_9PELO|nr:unnamed protein product [Caenorhabditis auriculariae]